MHGNVSTYAVRTGSGYKESSFRVQSEMSVFEMECCAVFTRIWLLIDASEVDAVRIDS